MPARSVAPSSETLPRTRALHPPCPELRALLPVVPAVSPRARRARLCPGLELSRLPAHLWFPSSPLEPVGHVSAPGWSSAISRLTRDLRRHPLSLLGTSLPRFGAQPSPGSAPQPSSCIRVARRGLSSTTLLAWPNSPGMGETTGKGTPDPAVGVGRVCFSPSLKQVHRVPSSHGPHGPRLPGAPHQLALARTCSGSLRTSPRASSQPQASPSNSSSP